MSRYLTIQRLNGEEYILNMENGFKVIKFQPDSPSPRIESEYVEGLDGYIDMGADYEERRIESSLFFYAYDANDYPLKRNEIFRIFASKEQFYVIDSREPGKRWLVRAEGYSPEQLKDKLGYFDVTSHSNSIANLSNEIGSKASLPSWLQKSLYEVSKQFDDYLRQTGINVKQPPYNATGNKTTDDTQAFKAAIAKAESQKMRIIIVPDGDYKITETLKITKDHVKFKGVGDRYNHSHLWFYGTGELFQLHEDTQGGESGYLSNDYTGQANHFFIDSISMNYDGNGTAPVGYLENNPSEFYGKGTYAIRDWRCGHVYLTNVSISRFDYAFWGVASDLNRFDSLSVNYCKHGITALPRSDQFTINNYYTFSNDEIISIDGAANVTFNGGASDNDGSDNICPISIEATYKDTTNITFNDFWFEHYGGYDPENVPNRTVPAWIDLGRNGSYTVSDIVFNKPQMITNPQTEDYKTEYFIRAGHAQRFSVIKPNGDINNLKTLVLADSDIPVTFMIDGMDGSKQYSQEAGTFKIFDAINGTEVEPHEFGHAYGNSFIRNTYGKLTIKPSYSGYEDLTFKITPDSGFLVETPSRGEIINFDRKIRFSSSIPTTPGELEGEIVFCKDSYQGAPFAWVWTEDNEWLPVGNLGTVLTTVFGDSYLKNEYGALTIQAEYAAYEDMKLQTTTDKGFKVNIANRTTGDLINVYRKIHTRFNGYTTGTHEKGDLVISSDPNNSEYAFFVCTTSGTGSSAKWTGVGQMKRSGSTRPTNQYEGMMFFDKNLNKPIWWNGTGWVDANGVAV